MPSSKKRGSANASILPIFHRKQEDDKDAGNGSAGITNIRKKNKKGASASSADHSNATHEEGVDANGNDSRRTSMSREAEGDSDEYRIRRHIGTETFVHSLPDADTSLQHCAQVVEKHDIAMCQHDREEIDTLLVFAGLFSAVQTAFIMESYKWMLQGPDDASADYLRQILAVVSNTDVSSVTTIAKIEPLPSIVEARINGCFFSSLALSLTSALVGIMSKQWLREYLRDTGHSYGTNLSVRQVRYEGLTHWKVGAVVSAVPLLLQTALFLFFIAIVDLMWHLNMGVAIVMSILCSSTMLFFFLTSILPGIQYIRHRRGLHLHTVYQLPFKSPQAWAFMQGTVLIANFCAWLASLTQRKLNQHVAPYQTFESWTQFDLDWMRRCDASATWNDEPIALARCLGFMSITFEHNSLRDWIWNCLWHMRNKAANAKHVLQCFRRDPKSEIGLHLPEGRLIKTVEALLDPRGNSRATAEAVMLALLQTGRAAPRPEACLEHIIRIFNSLDMRGVDHISQRMFEVMQNGLQALSNKPCSPDLRFQMFYITQSLLRKMRDAADRDTLRLVSTILRHLIQSEAQDIQGIPVHSAADLSLDVGGEVMEWLKQHEIPDNTGAWADFKSHVFWAAHIAVLLAQRLPTKGTSPSVPTSHPRLQEVHELVKLVHAKASSIPQDVLASWEPDGFDMDDLSVVQASLEALFEAQTRSEWLGGSSSPRQATRTGSGRTNSGGTQDSECTALSTSDTVDPSKDDLSLNMVEDADTRVVHWGIPVDSEDEKDSIRSESEADPLAEGRTPETQLGDHLAPLQLPGDQSDQDHDLDTASLPDVVADCATMGTSVEQ